MTPLKIEEVSEHITPALIQLHWLPVKQRALYKLALITFNVLQHNNPMYLRDLLTTHNPSRYLRSSSQHLLSVGYMRTAGPSYPMGPLGPGPGPPSLRGPPNSPCIIFSSGEIIVTNCVIFHWLNK